MNSKDLNSDWMNNPKLKNIDKEKLKILIPLISQASDKKQNELAPFLLAAASGARKKGVTFSKEELQLIIDSIKTGKSPEEVNRINNMLQMTQMFR